MKKLLLSAISLTMLLCVAACANEEVTLEKLADANRISALLEKYDSVRLSNSFEGEIDIDIYMTDEYVRETYGNRVYYTSDQVEYVFEDGKYLRQLYLEEDGLRNCAEYRAQHYNFHIIGGNPLDEEVVSITEEDDRIIVNTRPIGEQTAGFAESETGIPEIDYIYEVDAKSNHVIRAKSILKYEDGTIEEDYTECIYNGEAPEIVNAFLELENQTEDLRTFTLVLNPGTDKELTETVHSPKGIGANLFGFYEAYSDYACTQRYTASGDHNADVTMYIKFPS